MPERIFKYQSVPELLKLAKSLMESMTTGSTIGLKNSNTGFLIQSGPLSQQDAKRRFMDVRYEIYLRGQGDPNNAIASDPTCLALEPSNPLQEKVMRVLTVRGGYGGTPFNFTPNAL